MQLGICTCDDTEWLSSQAVNFLLKVVPIGDLSTIGLVDYILDIDDSLFAESLWAHCQDNFRCTLNINGNLTRPVWVLNCNS